jgi:hypothetical protein
MAPDAKQTALAMLKPGRLPKRETFAFVEAIIWL